MKLKFDRTTQIFIAGMIALVIFSAVLIHMNHTLRERNSALETLIGSALTPHPALPSAGDLDNWSGGLWKRISENGSVLTGQAEASSNIVWLDEVEKVSAVRFYREASGWESLRFVAVELSSVTSAENVFAYIKERTENSEWENTYAVKSDEDLIRFDSSYSDATVFRKDKALFMVNLAGDNIERWASAPYAELLKGRIKKSV